ncbi:acyl-CoA dehydrogenase family protein [Rhodococcus aerolatus]
MSTATATGRAVLEPLPGDLYGYQELLSDEDAEVVARLRAFLAAEVAPIATQCWADAEFPHHVVPGLGALGVVGHNIDWSTVEPGGPPTRSKLLTSFLNLELARVDLSMTSFFSVHNGLTMTTIDLCGSDEQRRRWLPRMRDLELVGAFGLSEPHGGSDVAGGLETTATRDGDGWVLEGEKRWIGNGTFADLVVIWARDTADDAVNGFVVQKGTPGFETRKIEGKMALRTVQNADITLHEVRVPEADRLQRAQSFADTSKVLRHTRGAVAWNAVGAMMTAYDLAVAYAQEREQFGRPIAGFQLIQEHLTTILGHLTASFGMAVKVAQLQDAGVFRDEQAALAKSVCTQRLRESVAHAREVMGGNGIVLEHGIAKIFNDAEALYSYEGTREINTLLVGRAITGVSAFT